MPEVNQNYSEPSHCSDWINNLFDGFLQCFPVILRDLSVTYCSSRSKCNNLLQRWQCCQPLPTHLGLSQEGMDEASDKSVCNQRPCELHTFTHTAAGRFPPHVTVVRPNIHRMIVMNLPLSRNIDKYPSPPSHPEAQNKPVREQWAQGLTEGGVEDQEVSSRKAGGAGLHGLPQSYLRAHLRAGHRAGLTMAARVNHNIRAVCGD